MLFVTHYSFDLRFNDVDVAFVLRSFCLSLSLGLEGCCLVNNTGDGGRNSVVVFITVSSRRESIKMTKNCGS